MLYVFMRENKWKGEREGEYVCVFVYVWEREKKDEPGPSYEGSRQKCAFPCKKREQECKQ